MDRKNQSSARSEDLKGFLERKVVDHMSTNVVSISPKQTLRELGELIETYDFNMIPVLDQGKLVGIVTKFDFLRAFAFTTKSLIPDYSEIMRTPIEKIMSKNINAVEPATPLTRVLSIMVEQRARSVPVVGSAEQLAGIISREDIMLALRESVRAN